MDKELFLMTKIITKEGRKSFKKLHQKINLDDNFKETLNRILE